MKKNNKGFMLAETLIVTTFVASVLIYLFIQFSSLNSSFENSYNYNTIESVYALEDVRAFISNDDKFTNYLSSNIDKINYIDITDCTLFTHTNYCLKLFEVENIDKIFVTTNDVPTGSITQYNGDFTDFIKKINEEGKEPYRIVASFKDLTFATVRFEV